jgi:hypothetical protein
MSPKPFSAASSTARPPFVPLLSKPATREVATRARQPGMAEEILRYTTALV